MSNWMKPSEETCVGIIMIARMSLNAEAFVIDGRDEKAREKAEEDFARLSELLDEMAADFNYDEDEDE